ncbi:MAG: hypothetical protein LBD22_05865 [Spirochaetaceae bacterium]|jgi:hypothetical protein|nr:hypothetical protein [Spirochaetaceae bacterium]
MSYSRIKPLVIALFGTLCFPHFASPQDTQQSEVPGIEQLLAGYLERDAGIKELVLKMRQTELERNRTGIEQGINVNLSTGIMRLMFSEETSSLDVVPRAELELPSLNGTNISISVPMTVGSGTAASFDVENAQIALSTELTTRAQKQRKLDLIKADRALLEAKRALNVQALTAEKLFFETLRSLYEHEADALSKEEEAYTKEIELALAQSQGYPPSSVRYRTVELEAAHAHRAAERQHHIFHRNLSIFARDCGAFMTKLPENVTELNIEEAGEFGQNDEKLRFAALESAKWQAYLGKMTRDAEGNFGLSAKGGFTAHNTYLTKRTSADIGLTLDWKGVGLSLGAELPLSGTNKTPAFTLSFNFNTRTQRLSTFQDAEKKIALEREALALTNAERNWEETVDAMREERADLIWEKTRSIEQHKLYRELANDTTAWYHRGVISESEWRKTSINEKRARYQILIAELAIRIHFINAALCFVED